MAELSDIQKATQIYSEMGSTPISYGQVPGRQLSGASQQMISQGYTPTWDNPRSVGTTRTPGGGSTDEDTWRYGSPGDIRRGPSVSIPKGGGGGAGSMTRAPIMPPEYKPVDFKAPDKFALPDYKPPERDESEERRFRREYMGPGMAQVRRSTSEAMISSRQLDNPNARALFVKQALSGVGEAVEQVAGGAQKQARAESARRYAEDVANYQNMWTAKILPEAQANYEAQWNKAVMDYQQQVFGAQAKYQAGAQMAAQGYGPGETGQLEGGGYAPGWGKSGYKAGHPGGHTLAVSNPGSDPYHYNKYVNF